MTVPARRSGFTLVETMVVLSVMGILATAALLNFSDVRTATALNEATKSIINSVEKARQYSAAGREFEVGVYPSYGVAFRTSEPRDVTVFADCRLDDTGNGTVGFEDNFSYPSGTGCGSASGMVERVRISSNPRVAIRAVQAVVDAPQAQDQAAIVYVRPDPTTWVSGTDGSVLPYGRLDVVVGDESGEHERVIQFWTSGLIEVAPAEAVTAAAIPLLKVGSSLWSDTFRAEVDPDSLGYPVSGETPLPWANIDRLYVRFSADPPVTPQASHFTLTGVNTATYGINSVTYEAATRTAALMLAAPVGPDRLRLSIRDILPAGAELAFTVLPGDVNQSGSVAVNDNALLPSGLGSTVGSPRYSIFADLNGSGGIAVDDVAPLRAHLGQSLP